MTRHDEARALVARLNNLNEIFRVRGEILGCGEAAVEPLAELLLSPPSAFSEARVAAAECLGALGVFQQPARQRSGYRCAHSRPGLLRSGRYRTGASVCGRDGAQCRGTTVMQVPLSEGLRCFASSSAQQPPDRRRPGSRPDGRYQGHSLSDRMPGR